MKKIASSSIHDAFIIGILIKAGIGVAEVLAGIAFYYSGDALMRVLAAAQNTLVAHPHDVFARSLVQVIAQLPLEQKLFGALYLITRGGIKIGLIAALLKHKLWAYPLSIAVIVAFMAYQVRDVYLTHSLFMIALTIFDCVVVWLIWQEYLSRKYRLDCV